MSASPIARPYRLRKKRDFVALFRRGKRLEGRHFSLQVCRTDNACNRMACSVAKRLGNAVCRNRIRRRLREVYRKKAFLPEKGLDILFIAKPAILSAGIADIESDMERLFREIESI